MWGVHWLSQKVLSCTPQHETLHLCFSFFCFLCLLLSPSVPISLPACLSLSLSRSSYFTSSLALSHSLLLSPSPRPHTLCLSPQYALSFGSISVHISSLSITKIHIMENYRVHPLVVHPPDVTSLWLMLPSFSSFTHTKSFSPEWWIAVLFLLYVFREGVFVCVYVWWMMHEDVGHLVPVVRQLSSVGPAALQHTCKWNEDVKAPMHKWKQLPICGVGAYNLIWRGWRVIWSMLFFTEDPNIRCTAQLHGAQPYCRHMHMQAWSPTCKNGKRPTRPQPTPPPSKHDARTVHRGMPEPTHPAVSSASSDRQTLRVY